MHKEILNELQLKLLPFLRQFKKDFFLVGGTAIALYLGHRKSIDFDLFTTKKINKKALIKKIYDNRMKIDAVLIENSDEYTVVLNGVKFTFLFYPFDIKPKVKFEDFIMLPELLDLAAMKAYTLGRRATLKDYVDMYFLFRDHFSLDEIVGKAKRLFDNAFNEKLFRQQLCYFEDIDLKVKLNLVKEKIDIAELKKYLSEIALT